MTHSQADARRTLIDLALAEDVGEGDWTTRWTVPEGRTGEAFVTAKQSVVLSGVKVACEVFRTVDPALEVDIRVAEGEAAEPGDVVLGIQGSLSGILTAERTALNFLGRLSGIATLTRAFVRAVEGTGAQVIDTRKTTPGLRHLEKAAVQAGGGANHRVGLHDMILIKENHIAGAGGVSAALSGVAARNEQGLKVEIEVRTLDEYDEASTHRPDRILLDNMTLEQLAEAVRRNRALTGARPLLEASGNVRLETVRAIAETGVDLISVGALTHSAPVADLSLRIPGLERS